VTNGLLDGLPEYLARGSGSLQVRRNGWPESLDSLERSKRGPQNPLCNKPWTHPEDGEIDSTGCSRCCAWQIRASADDRVSVRVDSDPFELIEIEMSI
jgi:hypothetical protein